MAVEYSYEDATRAIDGFLASGQGTEEIKEFVVGLVPLMAYYHEKCEGTVDLRASLRNRRIQKYVGIYGLVVEGLKYHRTSRVKFLRAAKYQMLGCIGYHIHRHATKRVLLKEHQREFTRKHPSELYAMRQHLDRIGAQDVYPLVAGGMYENYRS